MADSPVTRREFVRDGVAAAAGAAVGLTATLTVHAGNPEKADTSKILNYNPQMEYRRCGKTNLMVSAVCLGGHWKRVEVVARGQAAFEKNRADVVSRCIERGVNYIDACTGGEVMAYAKALRGRRDKMYLGFSWYENEVRFPQWRSVENLKESFDRGLKKAGLAHADLWRITCLEQSGQHDEAISHARAAICVPTITS